MIPSSELPIEDQQAAEGVDDVQYKVELRLGLNPLGWKALYTSHVRRHFAHQARLVQRASPDELRPQSTGVRPHVRSEVRCLLRKTAAVRILRTFVERVLDQALVASLCITAVALSASRIVGTTSLGSTAGQFVLDLTLAAVAILISTAVFFAGYVLVSLVGGAYIRFRSRIRLRFAFDRALETEASWALSIIVIVSVAYLLSRPERLQSLEHLPDSLATATTTGVLVGAWSAYLFGIWYLAATVNWLAAAVASRYLRRRFPDGRFVVGTAEYIARLSGARQELIGCWTYDFCRKRLRELELLSNDYERDWPKRVCATGRHGDEVTLHWTRRVTDDVHAADADILIGVGRRSEYVAAMTGALKAFLLGSVKTSGAAEVADAADRRGWGRRTGRVLAILLSLLAASASILVGVLQPDLPNHLAAWNWPDAIVEKLRLGRGIQPPLLTVGVAFLGLTAKLVAPQVSSVRGVSTRRG